MKVQLFCIRCGGEFFRTPSSIKVGRNKFCSVACKNADMTGRTKGTTVKVSIICPTCHETCLKYPSVIKQGAGIYCSKYCKEHCRTPHERFWPWVADDQGPAYCWDWIGWCDENGYGRFTVDRKNIGAHRFAYQECFGPIPAGQIVSHLCNRPPCCNPLHLVATTQEGNLQHMMVSQRSRSNVLTEEQVREILSLRGKMPPGQVAAKFNVVYQTIRAIYLGATWRHISL